MTQTNIRLNATRASNLINRIISIVKNIPGIIFRLRLCVIVDKILYTVRTSHLLLYLEYSRRQFGTSLTWVPRFSMKNVPIDY